MLQILIEHIQIFVWITAFLLHQNLTPLTALSSTMLNIYLDEQKNYWPMSQGLINFNKFAWISKTDRKHLRTMIVRQTKADKPSINLRSLEDVKTGGEMSIAYKRVAIIIHIDNSIYIKLTINQISALWIIVCYSETLLNYCHIQMALSPKKPSINRLLCLTTSLAPPMTRMVVHILPDQKRCLYRSPASKINFS